jgi:hypothetical protein
MSELCINSLYVLAYEKTFFESLNAASKIFR